MGMRDHPDSYGFGAWLRRIGYHPAATPRQQLAHETVRALIGDLGARLDYLLPHASIPQPGRGDEKTQVFDLLVDVLVRANRALAVEGGPPENVTTGSLRAMLDESLTHGWQGNAGQAFAPGTALADFDRGAYDSSGDLPAGVTSVPSDTGTSEPVLTAEQTAASLAGEVGQQEPPTPTDTDVDPGNDRSGAEDGTVTKEAFVLGGFALAQLAATAVLDDVSQTLTHALADARRRYRRILTPGTPENEVAVRALYEDMQREQEQRRQRERGDD
jgi:hypothetical protein